MRPRDIPHEQRWALGDMRDMVFASALCTSHKVLMLVVMHHMRPDQTHAWPSWDLLTKETSISRPVLAKRLPELIDKDWLLREKSHHVGPSGRSPDCYWTPRRDVVPQVPEHCSKRSSQSRNLRRGQLPGHLSSVHGT